MNSFQVKVHFVHAEGPIPLSDQFTCAEDERTDQIRALVLKVLKPETQNCLGPKLEVTRQKEAPHCEKLHRRVPGETPLSLPFHWATERTVKGHGQDRRLLWVPSSSWLP